MDALPAASPDRPMAELELALLYRGITERKAKRQVCQRCRRTPLIGERVYRAGPRGVLCALCWSQAVDPPADWTLVHGPEFGHTLRILDRHAA